MEDVGVGDGNLEQEPKNILVIFAAFRNWSFLSTPPMNC
jgi:hypothetical protein